MNDQAVKNFVVRAAKAEDDVRRVRAIRRMLQMVLSQWKKGGPFNPRMDLKTAQAEIVRLSEEFRGERHLWKARNNVRHAYLMPGRFTRQEAISDITAAIGWLGKYEAYYQRKR